MWGGGGKKHKSKICMDAFDGNLCYLFFQSDRSKNNFICSSLNFTMPHLVQSLQFFCQMRQNLNKLLDCCYLLQNYE